AADLRSSGRSHWLALRSQFLQWTSFHRTAVTRQPTSLQSATLLGAIDCEKARKGPGNRHATQHAGPFRRSPRLPSGDAAGKLRTPDYSQHDVLHGFYDHAAERPGEADQGYGVLRPGRSSDLICPAS